MPGRRGKLLVGLLAAAVAVPASAIAAQESVIATKSRAASAADASPLGAAAKKKKKKKKKKGSPATTQSSQAPFSSSQIIALTAFCPARSHISGGGFAVSPSFTPPSAGLRSVTSTNQPASATSWNAGGASFSTPIASGSFTAFARCERDRAAKLHSILRDSAILSPGNSQTFTFNCPPGNHVVSGGYAGAGLGAFTYSPANLRIILLQSRRTGPGQWVVQALNSSNSPVASTVTGFALCEQDARGRTISEVSSFTALIDDARASGDPTCTGKTHVVSGGFVISPNGIGAIPATAIDEFQPIGAKTWHVGLHELVQVNLPPGSSLQSYAYCAPDSVAKKRKKKKTK